MKSMILLHILSVILIAGCSKSSISYTDGKKMADKTYGAMAPQDMMKQMESVIKQVHTELEKAENKKEYWNGFCDRGEDIWLANIEKINKAMGQAVLNTGQINTMFNKMRSSFRE